MSQKLCKVAIDGALGSFDKLYTYAVPNELSGAALLGCRVTVPFGRGDAKKQGIIMEFCYEEYSPKFKDILEVTDKNPILNREMLELCVWLKEHTFCTYFDAIHTMLPAGLNLLLKDFYSVNEEFVCSSLLEKQEQSIYEFLKVKGETQREKLEAAFGEIEDSLSSLVDKQALIKSSVPIRRMGDLKSRWLRIKNDDFSALKLTARQKEIAELVLELQSISVKELKYFSGVSDSVINSLISKDVFEAFEKEEFRITHKPQGYTGITDIVLTKEQEVAFCGLKEQLTLNKPQAALLYGVTGSGKTQVFLRLVDEAVKMGRGVIVMVPEIALTPQMLSIFSARYGDKTAVFHSAMSLGQRMDEYKRIKQGKALIAIGTRSAVFAPFEDLALIIMDEEQEHTYKSEKTPRFHARDIARFRANFHNALLCMASATPSIETYSKAKSGKYKLYQLENRYGNAVLPQVVTVDMLRERNEGNLGNISRELYESLENTLGEHKQAIILLNRRGHNTYISCSQCGYVATCPNCSVSLTYHSANNRLMCHYCGYSVEHTRVCPECSAENMRFSGAGTQRLEEEVQLLFPNAKILRMDADNTINRDSYNKYLTAFSKGEYDIMIGTQMVAKGLDFPNVTLVGVIGADASQNSEDYHSAERTFSLLTQVVGRAGRGEDKGQAVIQTTNPDTEVITLACGQDYTSFYDEEIKIRQLNVLPPFCDICVVWSQSTDAALAKETIDEFFKELKRALGEEFSDVKLMALGPAPAAMHKVNNRYRFRLTIKCKNNARFRELIRKTMNIKLKRDASLSVDINPEGII